MANFIHTGSEVVYGESVSNVTLTNSVSLGMERQDDAGNKYIYVYNAGNSVIGQGLAAIISGSSGYSVTVSSVTAYDGFPLGIARNATIPTASYGWLMYRGFSGFTAQANDSFVTGDPICLANDGKMANKTQATGYIAASTIGKCILSTASGTSNAGTIAAYFNIM